MQRSAPGLKGMLNPPGKAPVSGQGMVGSLQSCPRIAGERQGLREEKTATDRRVSSSAPFPGSERPPLSFLTIFLIPKKLLCHLFGDRGLWRQAKSCAQSHSCPLPTCWNHHCWSTLHAQHTQDVCAVVNPVMSKQERKRECVRC